MAIKTRKRSNPTPAARAKATEERKVEAEELHRTIALRVQTLAEAPEWLAYLDFLKSFRTYSFNNIMLMMAQRQHQGLPEPTLVAGFKAWQDKGRQVRKGETGLRIFGYRSILLTGDDGEPILDDKGRKQFRPYYPIVSVFDIDQTDPIDGADQALGATTPPLLTGEDTWQVTERVAAWLTGIDFDLSFAKQPGERRGRTLTDGTRRIEIDTRLEPAMQAKTALHEMAHVILHVNGDGKLMEDAPSQAVRELEAESAAYVAGAILGLDTMAYSERYLLSWASATDQPAGDAVKATAGRVQRAVKKMVDALEVK